MNARGHCTGAKEVYKAGGVWERGGGGGGVVLVNVWLTGRVSSFYVEFVHLKKARVTPGGTTWVVNFYSCDFIVQMRRSRGVGLERGERVSVQVGRGATYYTRGRSRKCGVGGSACVSVVACKSADGGGMWRRRLTPCHRPVPSYFRLWQSGVSRSIPSCAAVWSMESPCVHRELLGYCRLATTFD